MKFLCVDCDQQMRFEEREVPGDGTFAAAFRCPACGRKVALLANPMETQLVRALDVQIGGRTLDPEPLGLIRSTVAGKEDAFAEPELIPEPAGRPRWSAAAEERLARVPGFVRGMVRKIYHDYARERGISEITPDIMDQARAELGLEGM
ncbi:MAG: PCP reductase family protein [Gemmatimonadales bacterium]